MAQFDLIIISSSFLCFSLEQLLSSFFYCYNIADSKESGRTKWKIEKCWIADVWVGGKYQSYTSFLRYKIYYKFYTNLLLCLQNTVNYINSRQIIQNKMRSMNTNLTEIGRVDATLARRISKHILIKCNEFAHPATTQLSEGRSSAVSHAYIMGRLIILWNHSSNISVEVADLRLILRTSLVILVHWKTILWCWHWYDIISLGYSFVCMFYSCFWLFVLDRVPDIWWNFLFIFYQNGYCHFLISQLFSVNKWKIGTDWCWYCTYFYLKFYFASYIDAIITISKFILEFQGILIIWK